MTVQELLSSEDKWTRGELARDKSGNLVGPHSPDAVCWCLGGAIIKCYPGYSPEALSAYRKLEGKIDVPAFNDDPETTFADVRRVVEGI